ncbi:hypothetical protein FRC12_014534 [Ceratobasidium sp. 428]|nr:hypothetical protein FRC12_014534 [Ceratobasidium sp. 428]
MTPGVENTVADALLRIYADEPKGMERAPSEYVPEDEDPEEQMQCAHICWDEREALTIPVLVANAAVAPESLAALEKEIEGEGFSKGALEGGTGPGTEEEPKEGLPETRDTLRRYPG